MTRIDGRKLTVESDNQTKELNVPESLAIRRNTMDAKFDEIKVNDDIEWTQSAEGALLSLQATSGKVSDFGKWTIPIVILLLLLIGLVAYLMKKKNQGHIKTPTEQITN